MAATSPKQAGGGGFTFADKVAAFFFAAMLRDANPLTADRVGSLEQVDFEAAADGWFLDDFVLTFDDGGVKRRCAFSAKSQNRFTGGTVDDDFLGRSWKQVLHHGSSVFREDVDLLGYAVHPPAAEVQSAIRKLTALARAEQPAVLAQRIRQPRFASAADRRLFASFAPPPFAAALGAGEEDIGRILRSLVVLSFDVDDTASARIEQAIGWCREALRSGDATEASDLFGRLVALAAEQRGLAGNMTRGRLIRLLAPQFELKRHPRFERDWERLARATQERLHAVRDVIGPTSSIRRTDALDEIATALATHRAAVVVGRSGTGKTVIAKQYLDASTATPLWLRPNDLETSTLTQLESSLSLSYPLAEVLPTCAAADGVLVVDALDRLYHQEGFEVLASLLRAVDLTGPESPWRVVMTCQAEEWSRVEDALVRAGIAVADFARVDVASPSWAELQPVWTALPQLAALASQPRLRSLLSRPKILDVVARRLDGGGGTAASQWAGESDVIEWFWATEVERAPAAVERSRFMMDLGRRQADELRLETPLRELPASTVIDDLVNDRLCRRGDQRIAFDHDLYGDWSRQRLLIGEGDRAADYLSDQQLLSPLWHRAVRLYSLHLLERHAVETWVAELEKLQARSPLLGDLMVEAAIFGAAPRDALETIWPALEADGGRLLKRLLKRFLHVATLRNPEILAFFANDSSVSQSELETIQRIPLPIFWPPVLAMLNDHGAVAADAAQHYSATIADMWLRSAPAGWSGRREAAQFGLLLGQTMFAFESAPHDERLRQVEAAGGQKQTSPVAYRAALAAATELPDEVVEFARLITNRHPDSPVAVEQHGPFGARHQLPEPWPLGPSDRIERSVESVALSFDALQPLMEARPDVAREVILAALIDEPDVPDRWGMMSEFFDDLAINDVSEWRAPLWHRGPFITFLRTNPDEGVRLVEQLVEFATERLLERQPAESVAIVVDGEAHAVDGGPAVFGWHRNAAQAPNAVVVALMALEKWLYEAVDNDRETAERMLTSLVRSLRTTAIANVLLAVGSRTPDLFAGPLQPLLAVHEFLAWDFTMKSMSQMGGGPWYGNFFLEGDQIQQLAQEWHSLPHRSTKLEDIAVQMFVKGLLRDEFLAARQRWEEELATPDHPYERQLSRLILLFDLDRWESVETADGLGWKFVPPDDVLQESERRLEEHQEINLAPNLAHYCRRVLDGEQQFNEDGAEELWLMVERVAASEPDSPATALLGTRADARAGIAAVLLTKCRDWLERHPEAQTWCIEEVVAAAGAADDTDVWLRPWSQQSFAADIVPSLWAVDSGDARLRGCAARLATHPNSDVIRRFFLAVSAQRQHLSLDDVIDLQALALWWALESSPVRDAAPAAPRLPGAVEAFINGERVDNPEWKRIDYFPIDEPSRDRRRRQSAAGIPIARLPVVVAAHDWMPLFGELSSAEQQHWLGFWRDALDLSLSVMGAPLEAEVDIDAMPTDWEQWLTEQLARVVGEASVAGCDVRGIWQPILEIGPYAHLWATHFLFEWFKRKLVNTAIDDEVFVRVWADMFDFCVDAPEWDYPRGGFYTDELWVSIAGLDYLYAEAWSEEQARIIDQMKPYFETWVDKNLLGSKCATAFMRFLRTPAAAGLLLDGIVWIDMVVSSRASGLWLDGDLDDELVRLLDFAWQAASPRVKERPDVFNSFRALLMRLAERQNAAAYVLLERLAA